MSDTPHSICIGSVLWDVIGRSPSQMRQGSDVPGRITRLPGGVALNIAMTLTRFSLPATLLTAIGRDAEGDELVRACADMGMDVDHIYRSDDLPTDRYMAIEGANGVIAAIADAHSLETAGASILAPLRSGPLAGFSGPVALDGNLTLAVLQEIAVDPAFDACDLRVAPASPGKAERLLPFINHARGTLYVNLEEAGHLCQTTFPDACTAARTLVDRGAARALVTDGGHAASEAISGADPITQTPPQVRVTRLTGAGDTFMAAHIAAEADGADRDTALLRALQAAAAYVSGDPPL